MTCAFVLGRWAALIAGSVNAAVVDALAISMIACTGQSRSARMHRVVVGLGHVPSPISDA